MGTKKIIGREQELKLLNGFYNADESKLIVLYGRRRIGKSFLLKNFISKKAGYYFDGIERGSQKEQLRHIANQLFVQTNDPLLRGFNPQSWHDFFETLITVLQKKQKGKKTIIVLDEIQWMASGRTLILGILKSYWDNRFINENVLLILCGSVAHYMVKKVIKSKALYGRISSQILLQQLEPRYSRIMLSKRGSLEALKYIILFGGVPKYLEEINTNISFDENIESLCLKSSGFFNGEIEKIFFSQFKEAKTYKKIIDLLCERHYTLEELAKNLKMKSGGGLKDYLIHLEMAQFIRKNLPILNMNKKIITYRTSDEFIRFYFQYIKKWDFQKRYDESSIFMEHIKPFWNPWLGLAFENFCIKNAYSLSQKMGFSNQVINWGPLITKDRKKITAQFDLVYERNDQVVTVCEIKWSQGPVGNSLISEMESKIIKGNFANHLTIERVLIAPMGASQSLIDSKYFNRILTLESLFS